MRPSVHYIFVALLLLSTVAVTSARPESGHESSVELEYQVKAGFVFNFLRFVSWPPAASENTDVWRVAVLAKEEIVALMRETLAGKSFGGKAVVVTTVDALQPGEQPHLVFVARTHSGEVDEIFRSMPSAAVLVVGESAGFARKIGIIGFVKQRDSLRLEINPSRAQKAGLVISGKLASLAKIVGEES